MFASRKGIAGNMITLFIGLMVTVIIAVSVVIPTVMTTLNSSNINGTALTLLNIVPLLLAVAIVVLIVSIIR